jgi:hypothetical protein
VKCPTPFVRNISDRGLVQVDPVVHFIITSPTHTHTHTQKETHTHSRVCVCINELIVSIFYDSHSFFSVVSPTPLPPAVSSSPDANGFGAQRKTFRISPKIWRMIWFRFKRIGLRHYVYMYNPSLYICVGWERKIRASASDLCVAFGPKTKFLFLNVCVYLY